MHFTHSKCKHNSKLKQYPRLLVIAVHVHYDALAISNADTNLHKTDKKVAEEAENSLIHGHHGSVELHLDQISKLPEFSVMTLGI